MIKKGDFINIAFVCKGPVITNSPSTMHAKGRCDRCGKNDLLFSWKPLQFYGRFVFNLCESCSENIAGSNDEPHLSESVKKTIEEYLAR